MAQIHVGNIYVNRNQIGAVVGSQPFGGEGLSGTGPKAGGPHYLARFTQMPPPVAGLEDSTTDEAIVQNALREAPASQALGAEILPGPTGESNRLIRYARPPILCLGPSAATAQAQARSLRTMGAQAIEAPGLDPAALTTLQGFSAVLWWGDNAQARVLALLQRQSPAGKQFNSTGLDRGLSLANELPGVSVSGSLHEGDEQGETELILKLYKNQSRRMELVADNYGSRATGDQRLMGNYSSINPTDRGDLFSLSSIITKGSEYLRGAYSLPIGHDGWRAGLNASAMNYEVVVGDVGVVGAVGKAFSQGIDFIYPIERSPKASSSLTLSAETKQFENIMATGNVLSEYESEVVLAQLSGSENEFNKVSGLFNYNFTVSHGQIRLQEGSSYQATDSTGNRTEGDFNKLRVNLSYLEPWSSNTDFFVGFSGQLADKNLDSSEKFQLGGAMGIRAYPTGEGSGSDGRMLNFELRHRLDNGVTLTGFYDWGHVDELHNPNENNPSLKNSYDLKGFGLSAGYNFSNGVSVKATWATREGSNPNPKIPSGLDQDGSRDRNRFWLQLSIPL